MNSALNTGNIRWGGARLLFVHVLSGIVIFYFIIHPITMVVYWFEFNQTNITLAVFYKAFVSRLGQSFTPEMQGMAAVFILIGGFIGLGSGIYALRIRKQNQTIIRQQRLMKRDIEAIIQQGESDRVEFKASLRYDYRKNQINTALETVILKTLAGFMNSGGGHLIIGLSDNGEILGIENDYSSLKKKDKDGFELKLLQLVADAIGPEYCHFIHILFFEFEGKEICVVDIEGANVPAYLKKKNDTVFYVRTGNSTKPLTVKQAVNYINMSKLFAN